MSKLHNAHCAQRHITDWLAEPAWLSGTVEAIRAGLHPMARDGVARESDVMAITNDGVAIISIIGAMMKGGSKFSDTTNSVLIRQAVRDAAADSTIKSIMLHIDSPGGTVAGTQELARDVLAARQSKPVHAFVDDMAASAALWIVSQTGHITAGQTSSIGSIGVIMVVTDSSKAAEMAGIKVHVIATGEHKGAGVPGTEITESHLSVFQERADDLNAIFIAAIASGRGMTVDAVSALADGSVMLAEKAKAAHLIDEVGTFESALERLKAAAAPSRNARARAQISRAKVKSLK